MRTLRHGKGAGWITPCGRDGRGSLYRLADVQAAALGITDGGTVQV